MLPAPLALEQVGNEFVLTKIQPDGKTDKISLSESDVLTLVQSAQRLMDHILQQRTPAGGAVSPVLTTPIAQAILNTDLHKSEIVLTMIGHNGAQIAFALPLTVAKPLSTRLPVRVAEIEAAQSGRASH